MIKHDEKIRVFVVDDSVVIRNFVATTLSNNPQIEVVGRASNGKVALKKLAQQDTDIVTLDVEMPEMNGLETLAELVKLYPHIRVIMFSTLTERGAKTTLEALSLGASDYAAKPSGGHQAAAEEIQKILIPKVLALGKALPRHKQALKKESGTDTLLSAHAGASAASKSLKERLQEFNPQILVIGISTGGPNALIKFIPTIPKDFPLPILLVQHMPPVFTKSLAERLDTNSEIKVVEAEQGMPIQAGTVYIAPGGYHLILSGSKTSPKVALTEDPPENSCRPAADPLFRSAASYFPKGTLCLVMTGMGYDGEKGAGAVLEAGGITIAQDEESSVVWGMPGALAKSGKADYLVPLDLLTTKIIGLSRKRKGPNGY
jgi:two-component system, chemotaxis family, protein-glutamate methylesterase/glutaminase